MMYVSQIIMLYILNLYGAVWQWYVNKTGGKRHCWKKIKKTQRNRKTFHAHRLEDLPLLKWPYYLKQCTDSMQSLSKSQGHFSLK